MRLNLTIVLLAWGLALIEMSKPHPDHSIIWACLLVQVYAIWRQRHLDKRVEDEIALIELELRDLEEEPLALGWDCEAMGHLLVMGSPQCHMCFHVEGTRCECRLCAYGVHDRRGGDDEVDSRRG